MTAASKTVGDRTTGIPTEAEVAVSDAGASTQATSANQKEKGRGREAMTIAVTYILISVCAGAIGQILLKYGMNRNGVVTLEAGGIADLLLRLVLNPYVMGGLILYAGGTIFWLAAISRVDLSFAYPFASLSYVIMLIASWQLFDEQISMIRLAGTGLIALGVLVISRS